MPPRRQSDGMGHDGPSEPTKRRSKEGKEKETFRCAFPGCGQTYSRMEYLKRHQRKHEDDRPFQCKDCTKSFARSDVLLRHRRRCHPTPPPVDRASHSPVPHHRGYPGVPVSSSRHDDYREYSPDMQARKHPRQSTGSNGDDRHSRPRLEEDEEEDDYAESSRFGRQNGMGNGGVYGADQFYTNDSSSSYTPHLLPMFQNANVFQQPPNEENHLEDASVLLSMAYPTGMPANEANSSNNKSHTETNAQDGVSDWETGQQTINMMMEQARTDTNGTTQNGDHATTSNETSQDTSPVLTEPLTFIGAMDWLNNQNNQNQKGGGPGPQSWLNTTNASPQPLSPFPFHSFISPSAFGLTLPADESQPNESNEGAVKSLLDMLAMYDTPETKTNPNPERPLLRIHHSDMYDRAGGEVSKNSRFYIPADRFSGCYQIPHWALPPLKTLSLMARRTCDTVLQHFSFVHMPTFRLIDTAACLAFAICTVGGIRTTADEQSPTSQKRLLMSQFLDGPAPPGSTWEDIYRDNYDQAGSQDPVTAQVGLWKNGVIVRNEKSNMLVKSFSLASGVLMTEYNVALLQALILYNAPFFLSEDESERHMANLFLGTIVNIARQIGFFNQELDHFDTEYQLPQEPHTPNDLNLYWRRWIQLETRRRTAYLVLQLDTISALESCIQCIVAPAEISQMPLPAPDSIWKAETADDWLKAIRNYRPMTLDEAMRRIFFLPTYGAFDTLHERADTKFYHLLNESEIGPFARVAMILTLLRGIIDIGEGKRDRGDWRDLTDLWVGCSWLKPTHKMLASDGQDLGPVTRDSLRERFALGLQRWREGWDFDPTCMSPGQSASNDTSPTSSSSTPSSRATKLNYCEEALPFYWLAQALLNLLQAAPPNEPGWNSFSGIKYRDMLKSSRTFTRMGEGVATSTDSGSGSGNGNVAGNGNGAGGFNGVGDLSNLFNDPHAWDTMAF